MKLSQHSAAHDLEPLRVGEAEADDDAEAAGSQPERGRRKKEEGIGD